MRRPRNSISRNLTLSLRAADLLDDGMTDAKVANVLSEEFGKSIKRKAVLAFRNSTYKDIQGERRERIDAAEKVRLIIASASDSGSIHAKAGTDLIAKMLYDVLKQGADVDVVAVGKTLAKIRQVENETIKLKIEKEKHEAALAAEKIAGDNTMSPEDRRKKMRELFGLQS